MHLKEAAADKRINLHKLLLKHSKEAAVSVNR
jgi:hypothetical protein